MPFLKWLIELQSGEQVERIEGTPDVDNEKFRELIKSTAVKGIWIETNYGTYGVDLRTGDFMVKGEWKGIVWSRHTNDCVPVGGFGFPFNMPSEYLRPIYFERVLQHRGTEADGSTKDWEQRFPCLGWQATVDDHGKSVNTKHMMWVYPDGSVVFC